jgi:membrane protein implicated in regulation of membrane protease activity
VKPTHRLVKGLLIAALLTTCVVSGLSFASRLFARVVEGAPVVLYVFVPVWLAATAILTVSLVWIIFGAQVASTRGGDLTVRHRIGPIVIGRPKVFTASDIQRIRVEERRYKIRGKAILRYAIIFDYLGRPSSLFEDLSKEQAESLLNGPLQRFAQSQA